MKPIYVKMSAFGSYAGEVTVDFGGLDHGIFLITGDTGAGKTTIFDAICYALYDQTSGGKRDGEMMRSQFASDDVRTYVEFKFSYKGDTYTVTRYPKQERISKRRNKDGEYTKTIDQAGVELIMPDGMPYRGKIKEINQKIVDIIGLDANQFTQIAMIAQGEFLKLLLAPSKERKEIFAKIFNTRIYARIEEELKELAKGINSRLEDNRRDIIRETENVYCIPGSVSEEIWAQTPRFSESNPDELLSVIRQIIDEARQKENDIIIKLTDSQNRLNQLLTELKQAEDTNRLFDNLSQLQARKALLDAKKDEMEGIRIKIDAAKRAAIVEPKELACQSKQKELSECSQRIVNIKAWLESNRHTLQERKRESELKEAEYKEKNPILASAVSRINELLPKFELLEELNYKLEQCGKNMDSAHKSYNLINESISKDEKLQDELSQEQAKLKNAAEDLLALSQSVERLAERKNSLDNLLVVLQTMQKLKSAYEFSVVQYKEAQANAAGKAEYYDSVYKKFIEGQAGILAHELRDGCPCPVCGSTSHPKPASLTETGISQQELEMAKKANEDAGKELEKKKEAMHLAGQHYEKQKAIAELEGKRSIGADFNADSTSIEEIKAALHDCLLRLGEEADKKKLAEAAKKAYDDNELRLIQLKERLEKYRQNKEKAAQLLKDAEIKLTELAAQIKNLQDSLIYDTREAATRELAATRQQMQQLEQAMTTSARSYRMLLEETNKMQGNLKAEEETAARLTQELMHLKEDFENEIVRQDFADLNAYRSSIMSAAQISQWEAAYRQFREELIRIESSISHYMELTRGKERINTELLEEKKRELEAEARKLDDTAKSVYGIRSRNEAILIKLQELYDNRQKLKKEYSVISRLEATATGKAGPKRINFQTYIQRRYFNSILYEANKRLYIMSNGQFILKCREIEDLANQGEVGLDLDVYSLVNDQSRDVKTLSGGESFMAALAMALGMADVIQNTAGRVHIDTMFIDEGFGSLSDEARMQAIKILQGLSEGKRLVGIISHVTELKAQIGTKLVVTKTSKGSQARWEIME